jgi:hypothetical protein
MIKMLRRRELFPAVEGCAETVLTATLRKGHRDLPVFFDELNDALEAHDVRLVWPHRRHNTGVARPSR